MPPEFVRAFAAILLRTECLGRKQLRDYQLSLLAKLLVHARQTTEFYKDRLDFDVHDKAQISRFWSDIPVLKRAQVADNFEKLNSGFVPAEAGPVIPGETTGSTATPLKFKTTAAQGVAARALTERMFRWWSVDGNRGFAQISHYKSEAPLPPEGLTMLGWHSEAPAGTKHILSHALDIDAQLDWLLLRRPDYVGSYSSILRELAVTAKRRGVDLKFDLLFSFGTSVDGETRALCKSAFGSEIADTYGAQETEHIAAQCPDCKEYHISAESSFVEVLRPDGSRCAPGEVGRVVVTPLYNYAMPLIRYDIGDFAEVGAVRPRCSRRLPTLRRILGRYRNMFRFRDGTTKWPFVDNIKLLEFIPAKQWQLVQIDWDRIEIRYVPQSAAVQEQFDSEALTTRVRNVLGQPVDVVLRRVENIARSANGKYEDCISLLPGE
jgi:phenylacetate-CoA ligase